MNDKEQKEAEAALTSNDVLQTISITSKTEERVKGANGEEDYKERLVEIARLSKSQILAGLKRQEPRVDKATSFVFGPCMEVEAIKVNADKYAIDKYDAKYVLLFSGYGGGCVQLFTPSPMVNNGIAKARYSRIAARSTARAPTKSN